MFQVLNSTAVKWYLETHSIHRQGRTNGLRRPWWTNTLRRPWRTNCQMVTLALLLQLCNGLNELNVITVPAEVGESYEHKVDANHQVVYYFDMPTINLPSRRSFLSQNKPLQSEDLPTVKIRTTLLDPDTADLSQPIIVNVRFNKGTTSWNIPFTRSSYNYTRMERTLCPLSSTEDLSSTQHIQVSVSTIHTKPQQFRMEIIPVNDFVVKFDTFKEITNLTVTSPTYFYVDFRGYDVTDALLQLRVTSEDEVCALVSIQPFLCPVSDEMENVKQISGTMYQTMLKGAAFTAERKQYMDGLFVVFIVLEDDSDCGNFQDLKNTHIRPYRYWKKKSHDMVRLASRTKRVKFIISSEQSTGKVAWEVVITVAILIGIITLVIIATACFSVYPTIKGKVWPATVAHPDMIGKQGHYKKTKSTIKLTSVSTNLNSNIQEQQDGDIEDHSDDSRNLALGMDSLDSGRTVVQFVSELATKASHEEERRKAKDMFQMSDLYIWLTLMMGIFYGIPALQLVMTNQQVLAETGNQDLCYYNFLCSVPVGSMKDFNHFFSNVGYVALGFLFLILTKYKSIKYQRLLNKTYESTEQGGRPTQLLTGIPQHFGIFYAMGLSLIFEGMFSACYHICPTRTNFQFDTTFMYVIGILCFMKIYQFRHPDITANAYKVFFGVGLVMFLEVMGIFYISTIFWILTLIGYSLLIIILTFSIYFSGAKPAWKLNSMTLIRAVKLLIASLTKKERQVWKDNFVLNRLILIIIMNGVNIGFIIYGALIQPVSVSSYFLFIFIVNLLVYALYYVTMKIANGEHTRAPALIYGALSLLCWAPALYFFMVKEKSTNKTPAESRNLNERCKIVNFYDNHDIWHFLSGLALFFSFMMLLTLDEGLANKKTNEIKIF